MRTPSTLLMMFAFSCGLAVSALGCDADRGPGGLRAGDLCDDFGEEVECRGGGVMLCGEDTDNWQSSDLVWTECVSELYECIPGESRSCGFSEPEFKNLTMQCVTNSDGEPGWDVNACATPLALSFDGGPIQMQASSAAFDITGAGACLDTDWPAATNPWLAIDLDHNGYIDGGHELFGSGSITEEGLHAKNGFIALAELDGNGDGKLDGADPRFDEVLVWRDEDGDKQSLPWELRTLAEEGILAIELAHHVEFECDARGNCGRERSRFVFAAGTGEAQFGEVIDIYPACN